MVCAVCWVYVCPSWWSGCTGWGPLRAVPVGVGTRFAPKGPERFGPVPGSKEMENGYYCVMTHVLTTGKCKVRLASSTVHTTRVPMLKAHLANIKSAAGRRRLQGPMHP